MAKSNAKGRSKKTPDDYFVQLYKTFLKEPAWKELSMGARVLYIAVKGFYNGNNNGELFLSVRDAAELIDCAPRSAHRWFSELIEKGFLRRTKGGSLGANGKGEARCWRLTEIGYRGQQPTREYREYSVPEKSETRIPQGHGPYPSGTQFEDKCIPQGNSCSPQGYSKGTQNAPPCIPQGNTYNIPRSGADKGATPTPSETPSNHVGDFAESTSDA